MIKLDFIIDENILKEDKSTDIINTDAGILEQTYFVFPVRFIANGIEMFEESHKTNILVGSLDELGNLVSENKQTISCWLPIPMLNIGIIGLDQVKRICNGEVKTTLYTIPEIGESLKFTFLGETIEIYSSINGYISQVNRTELLEHFVKFSNDIRDALFQKVPELVNHPAVVGWR
jgi:hypothetical protein